MLIRLLCPFSRQSIWHIRHNKCWLEKIQCHIDEMVRQVKSEKRSRIGSIYGLFSLIKLYWYVSSYKDNHENHTQLNNLKWFVDHFWFLLICLSKCKSFLWNDYNMCYLIERKRFCFLIKSTTFCYFSQCSLFVVQYSFIKTLNYVIFVWCLLGLEYTARKLQLQLVHQYDFTKYLRHDHPNLVLFEGHWHCILRTKYLT